MSEPLIKVENLSKKFSRSLKHSLWYAMQDLGSEVVGRRNDHRELRENEFWALKDINFELQRGECLGLIGPNGSGKSTLLKILNGLIKPDHGQVAIRGRVGALIELGAGFNPILTGRENIYINGSILGFSKKEIDRKFDDIVEFSEIGEFIDTPVQNYSSGMKVRLGFAIASQMEPDVLLLDEIITVGDIGFKAKCFNVMTNISKKAAVIFVSHQMPQIARACSDILVICHGKTIYQDTNIPEGIQYYYSQFVRQKGIVAGDGRAFIHNIELESDGKRNIECIPYLEDLTVHLDLSVDPIVKYPIIVVSFLNQELHHVAQCSSQFNRAEIPNTSGKPFHASVKFNNLNLNPGIYPLSIFIYDEHRKSILIKCHAIQELRITGNFIGFAPIQLVGEWAVS